MEFLEERRVRTAGGEGGGGRRVRGPVFVSIGSADQLRLFLEQNPNVPRGSILVDDYEHASYRETMGFRRFDETMSAGLLRDRRLWSKLIGPLWRNLGVAKLFAYARRVPALAPLEGDLDWMDLPEGGMRNGGTIVLGGGDAADLLYRWNDAIPGDVPRPSEVWKAAAGSEDVDE